MRKSMWTSVLGVAALAMASCGSEASTKDSGGCPPARVFAFEGVSYCVPAGATDVAACPPEFGHGRAFDGFILCGPAESIPDAAAQQARSLGLTPSPVAACADDSACPAGSVCELSTGCEEPRACVAGCHDAGQCAQGEVCHQPQCLTCPCPGFCEAVVQAGCADDSACPAGSVCEL